VKSKPAPKKKEEVKAKPAPKKKEEAVKSAPKKKEEVKEPAPKKKEDVKPVEEIKVEEQEETPDNDENGENGEEVSDEKEAEEKALESMKPKTKKRRRRRRKLKNKSDEERINTPFVGILTVQDERFHDQQKFWATGFFSYVTRSYVDLVSESGSQPIIIPFDIPLKNLDYLLENVQAMVFPGADAKKVYDGKPTLLQERIAYVLNKIKEFNDSGKYYPAFGECHGLQAPIIYLAGNDESYDNCIYRDYFTKHKVKKTNNYSKSRLWTHFDQNFLNRVWDSGEIYFSHNCGVSTEMIESHPVLNKEIMVTGSAKGKHG
jgi:hypothetical protein